MAIDRRELLWLTTAAAVLAGCPQAARAETYPARPVRILVGYSAGGGADIAARLIGQWLSERLGQQFVVENRTGAATNIATEAVVRSPPDGYTLLLVNAANAINATYYESLSFNVMRDVAPVAGIARYPYFMAVNPAFPASNVGEFIAYAKANPRKISVASFGTGTSSHVSAELFKTMTGTDLVHVPYRGAPQAHIDLMSGRVDVMFDTLTSSLPRIRSGALYPLAVAGRTRFPGLPSVPTIDETVPGYEGSAWAGVCAPKGTSASVIEKLNRELNAGLADTSVAAQLAEAASTPLLLNPAEFGTLMAAEAAKWAKVVKSAGIKPE
jgi:tripartite-type tricarboxylate transporter receptor subunit TctC